ncbi:MAG TPA: ATP-dependent Clp protease ATP-binding subunit [Bacteroidales bacterium]|nr:ATP-dependent Clp protease ATP-binding subunit [Bacteroidales bacterium]
MDFDHYSDELKNAIQVAQSIARENANDTFSPSHLLKAMMHKDFSLRQYLMSLKKDIYYMEEWAEVRIESHPKTSKVPELPKADAQTLAIFNEADNFRIKLSNDKIDLLAAFIALCTPGVGFSYEQLKSFPVTPAELLQSVVEKDALAATLGAPEAAKGEPGAKMNSLLKYTVDKTGLARSGKLETVIGREKEIRMIAEILGRRRNSNVMIIGDPGVGKTAVINGFCHFIVRNPAVEGISDLQVFEISFGNLLAGASYKGEVEDRLHSIFTEMKAFPNAVLVIEDIHELLDKYGSAPGATNVIKQELTRGEITLITTSTVDNFTKIIEKDNSFKRFFEILKVEESNDEEVLAVLSAIIPEYYEKHHGYQVSPVALKESVRLTRRYLKERSLPSAAIDLLDRTMSVVRTSRTYALVVADEIEKSLQDIPEGLPPDEHINRIRELMKQLAGKINPVILAQTEEINPEKFTEPEPLAGYLRSLLGMIREVASAGKKFIEPTDVAAVVSQKTNIPIGKLQSGEREKLLNSEQYLTQRVVGQDHAIKTITEAIVESRSGISKAGQPIGSFFFLGPTGTGKTELAKALAEFLFNDESAMIRFDMSEFKEEHSAALLYGAPPGYVGYEEGGVLVNKIRQRPYSVVLFDEIEKAHTSVFDIFLQILDEGKLHDRLGKEGDFSNSIVIFTSNIGSKFIVDSFEKGETPTSANLMEIMTKHFRPEFLGRLTEIIPFAPINQGIALKILEIHLKSLYKTLKEKKISLDLTDGAKEQLAIQGFNPQYGARPLIGVIRTQLRRPLSRKIIAGEVQENSRVAVDWKEDHYDWKTESNDK